MAGIIAFFGFIVYGFYYLIKEDEFLSPITFILVGFACVGFYLLKIHLYEAKYIYIDINEKTIYIETRHKGAFNYNFNDIRCVLRKNIGAQLEFKDGKKIELNKANVLIETTNSTKKIRNIEKEDLPGVFFINKL